MTVINELKSEIKIDVDMANYLKKTGIEKAIESTSEGAVTGLFWTWIIMYIVSLVLKKGVSKMIKSLEIPQMISFFTFIDIDYPQFVKTIFSYFNF